ncbi:MAG TPA: TRAP transporter substrate-binding protein DctP [Gammaproteobacteria bacterium]
MSRAKGGCPGAFWVLAVLTACAMALPAGAAELKVATIAPDGSQWMRSMRAGGEQIKERTAGRVVLKFYPGGVMGNDSQVLRRIRIGQLHGGAFTAGGLAERYPALNLYGVPLLFNSLEEVDFVRARLDPKLAAGLEAAGFVSFGFSEGGFANLMANEPIRNVDDLRRKKIWVPEGDAISFLAMESLGLSPVVLPATDVLTALQTGLLDVVANSPVGALVLQWHTKVRYRTELPVSYAMGIFALDARAFDSLTAEDREILREVMGGVMRDIDRASREDNRRAAEVMTNTGVAPIAVTNTDIEGLRSTIETIYPTLRGRADVDVAMFDELLAVIAEFRAQQAESSPADPGR